MRWKESGWWVTAGRLPDGVAKGKTAAPSTTIAH